MSAYFTTLTPMIDQKVLVEALCKTGFSRSQIEVHENPQNLVDYRGQQRKQNANVIVPRKHLGQASNDLGFTWTQTGFQMTVSNFDRAKYNRTWYKKLVAEYNEIEAVQKRKQAKELERLRREAKQFEEIKEVADAQTRYEARGRQKRLAEKEKETKKLNAIKQAVVAARKSEIISKAEEMGYEVSVKPRGKKVQLILVRRRG